MCVTCALICFAYLHSCLHFVGACSTPQHYDSPKRELLAAGDYVVLQIFASGDSFSAGESLVTLVTVVFRTIDSNRFPGPSPYFLTCHFTPAYIYRPNPFQYIIIFSLILGTKRHEKPDPWAIFLCSLLYFVILIVFAIYET